MSKTYRANPFARVLIPVFCALVAAAGARQIAAQEILPPDPGLCPTLEAADIWQAKESPHQIRVFYPSWLEVDRSSLGAGDILVTGPNGFERLAEFVSADYVPSVIPLPLPEDEGFVPVQRPALVATYAISPPLRENGSRAWTAAANGTYAVRLRAEQVALLGGGFLPAKLLGSFRVAIGGEPVPVQPVSTEIHIQRIPVPGADGQLVEAIYAAQVELTFATPHVRIEWEDLVREGDSFIARATAVRLPGFANIDPVNVPLAGDPNAESPDLLPVFTKRFELGDLPAGDYRFVVRVNGERTGVNEFSVSGEPPVDREPPKATLRTGNVMVAGGAAHRFRIAYEDRSGIDLDSLGDGDAVVQAPCLFADILPPFPCNWEAQRARLVEIAEVSASGNAAVAVYEIDAPAGGWSAAHNGFYTVVLANGEVSDTLGNANLRQVLGGFEVAIEPDGDPPVPAEVTLRVDASNLDRVRAHARTSNSSPTTGSSRSASCGRATNSSSAPRRSRLNVIAIFPPPPPPQEDLTFELGRSRPANTRRSFSSTAKRYTGQEFKVGEGEPIPAQVAMEIVTDAPGGVHAAVTVQFETPHLLVPGEVRRDGSRIVLPARAEPIPVPDGAQVRPGPITVEYPIGNLPPGAYLAVFEVNGHPYAAEDFRIDDPGEPIPAEVALRFDTGDPAAVKAFAIVEFRAPYVITGHRAHRDGNAILLEASAAPLTADHGGVLANAAGVLPPNPVILEFPLGELPPGVYFARFVMNGFPYAAEDFRVEDSSSEFEAEVDLRVDATDPEAVDALAHVVFANPFATIVNPGEPRRDGSVIRINAEAALRDGPPPGEGNNENAEPSVADLSYSLGSLAPGGYTLVFAINGRTEARAEFTVRNTPIPAEVELKVDVSTQPVTATAVVQFRDHYRIAETAVEREGNRIILVARAEGPLPILSPLPPQPITLTFKLGELAPGGYLAVFEMNGATYAAEDFRVGEPGDPFEADVKLEVAASNDGKVRVKAVVDFVDPFVVLVEPGEVVRDSAGVFHIRAAAAAVQFFAPPDGAPQTYTYEFEADPGEYSLVFSINGNPEAHARFAVPGDPPPPVPHVAHIDIAQGNASWFAEVGVILLPGQEVVSWGEVRTDGRQFFVEIEVEWVDFPPPIDPIALPGELPDGVAVNAVEATRRDRRRRSGSSPTATCSASSSRANTLSTSCPAAPRSPAKASSCRAWVRQPNCAPITSRNRKTDRIALRSTFTTLTGWTTDRSKTRRSSSPGAMALNAAPSWSNTRAPTTSSERAGSASIRSPRPAMTAPGTRKTPVATACASSARRCSTCKATRWPTANSAALPRASCRSRPSHPAPRSSSQRACWRKKVSGSPMSKSARKE
ncbi:MAG: hypothetical protein R3F11_32150 [Verrucomicrobiales bacterium]